MKCLTLQNVVVTSAGNILSKCCFSSSRRNANMFEGALVIVTKQILFNHLNIHTGHIPTILTNNIVTMINLSISNLSARHSFRFKGSNLLHQLKCVETCQVFSSTNHWYSDQLIWWSFSDNLTIRIDGGNLRKHPSQGSWCAQLHDTRIWICSKLYMG